MNLEKPVSRPLYAAAAVLCAGTVAVYLIALHLAGGSGLRFAWYAVAVFFCILPGRLLTQLLLPDMRGAARIPCAFLLGAAFLFVAYLTFGRIAPPVMAVPIALADAWLAVRMWRGRRAILPALRAVRLRRYHLLLVAAFAGGLLVYTFSGVLAFARASAVGNMEYHQDMMWSVGNAAAVQLGSPLPDIRNAGNLLRYHYLADALPGFAAMFSGVLPYEAVCFYTYPFILLCVVTGLYTAARRYGAHAPAAAALPFAVLFFNGWQSGNTLNLLRNMNGVATATAMTAALCTMIFPALGRVSRPSWRMLTAFSCGMLALLMSKNLYGILLCCALAATVVFGLLIQRRFYRGACALAALGLAIFGLCWQLVYRYAINNLVLTVWQSPGMLLRALFLGLPLGAVLWLIGAFDALRHLRTLPPARLVVNAAAVGGLLAYFIFHHYSASQEYFLLAAFLFCWFGALDALHLLCRFRLMQAAAALLAAAGLFCTLLVLLPVGRKGVQVALRSLGMRPQYEDTVQTVSAGDEAAALWLREHMRADEVFAVNRNAKDPAVGEGTWHYYTAMSGRQCYVESWRYSMDYGADYTKLRYQLEQVSDVIFAQADAAPAFEMAREAGIDYLLVSKRYKPDGFAGAHPAYENEAAAVYAVPAA